MKNKRPKTTNNLLEKGSFCAACSRNKSNTCVIHQHRVSISLDQFMDYIKLEVLRARVLFPHCHGVLAALTEETGEVAKAYLGESRHRIMKESIQCAAMAIRVALEGDPTMDEYRQGNELDF